MNVRDIMQSSTRLGLLQVRNRWSVRIVLCLMAVALVSCAPRIRRDGRVSQHSAPVISEYQSADPHFDSLGTFCIQPSHGTLPDRSLIDESVAAFYLRNGLEGRGYRFTPVPDSADFIVTLDLRGEHHQGRIPLRSIAVPEFDSDKKIVVEHSELGLRLQHPATASDIDTPGITQAILERGIVETTSPIYHGDEGDYYWIASVQLYDGRTRRAIWLANGIMYCDLRDYKLLFAELLSAMCIKLPEAGSKKTVIPSPGGYVGLYYRIVPVDGKHFLPFVNSVNFGAAAQRAGINADDVIIRINGESTMDRTFREVYEQFAGDAGVPVRISIVRNGHVQDFTVVRDPRPKDMLGTPH